MPPSCEKCDLSNGGLGCVKCMDTHVILDDGTCVPKVACPPEIIGCMPTQCYEDAAEYKCSKCMGTKIKFTTATMEELCIEPIACVTPWDT